MSLKNKTVVISGGSRGIGRAIALRFAQAGANIALMAKTAQPHPTLKGTIYTVAAEIEALGAQVLPLQVDIRDDERIQAAISEVVTHFGGIDILINNASAISLTPTAKTTMRRFDLMFAVNVRGTFACSQACLPHLAKADNPHIINLAPPLSMDKKWFKDYLAYTMSKYGMSMCTLGMAEEFKTQRIAVNSLWPKTTIATDAIAVHFPAEIYQASRKAQIVADAALHIVTQDSAQVSGNFFIDEQVLRDAGVDDFSQYAVNPAVPLFSDLFLE